MNDEIYLQITSLKKWKLFKIVKVALTHKNDDKTLPKNYKPISLLPNIRKLLEKLICNRLYTFLEQ